MKPKPFASLNHVTVPTCIDMLLSLCKKCGLSFALKMRTNAQALAHKKRNLGNRANWLPKEREEEKRPKKTHCLIRVQRAVYTIYAAGANYYCDGSCGRHKKRLGVERWAQEPHAERSTLN